MYPSVAIYGNWSVTLTTQILFTPTGGSETSIGTSSINFNWGPGTSPGAGSEQSVSTSVVLNDYGDGSYRTEGTSDGVCGGYDFGNPTGFPEYSSGTTISRPAAPTYTNGAYASTLAYFNGVFGSYTTANGSFANTTSLTAGAANGATGSFTWYVWQTGSHQPYASIPSCSGCTTNTITAQNQSDGCLVYNVLVTTSYDGFNSESLYMFIDRPSYLVKPSGQPDTFGNYGSQGYTANIYYNAWGLCSGQGVLGSYGFNEYFGTETDAVSNNWPHPESGNTLSTGDSLFWDYVSIAAGNNCGPYPSTTLCDPVPLNYGTTGALVQSVAQAWSVGTATAGGGIIVQRDSLDRYYDHPVHSSIVSPSN
jgi:hypothetical protein